MVTITNPTSAPNDLTGVQVGGSYTLVCILGEGGMGQVWLARAKDLDNREAAVKVLNKDAASNPEFLHRFKAEVRVVGSLRSNGVAEVWDAGVLPDGRYYMLMEYCDGGSLSSLLKKKGRLSVEETFACTAGPAQALRAAHAADLVHRDVKPDNILITHDEAGERAVLSDFGIAKLNADLIHDEFLRTGTGRVMGTVGYMAPEQLIPKLGVDHRADIFSFGCVVYRCLTGALPFPTGNVLEYCQAVWPHQASPQRPISPRQHRPEIPVELDALIMDCIELERQKRPSSIDVVIHRFASSFPGGQVLLRQRAPKFLDRSTDPTANTFSESLGVAFHQELEATQTRERQAIAAIQTRDRARRRSALAFVAGALLSGVGTAFVVGGLAHAPAGTASAAAAPVAQTSPALAAPPALAAKQPAFTSPPPNPIAPAPVGMNPGAAQPAASSASRPGVDTRPSEGNEPGVKTRDAAKLLATATAQDTAKPPAPAKLAPPPPTLPSQPARRPPSMTTTTDARPQPTTKAQDGVIAISVKQTWAQVWIDGAYQESTPVRATVPPGAHKVLLVSDGHRETVNVNVQAGGVYVVSRDW